MPHKIFIIAGETSGDLLGTSLASELLRVQPDLEINAMGGQQMRAAGVNIVVNNKSMDVVGWWDVIKNFGVIRAAMRAIKNIIVTSRPDLLILIDYPGFNLRM